jgi:hypothetical protein
MKLRFIPLLLAISALGFADGNLTNTSASAQVQLVAPISITTVHGLSFGTLVIDQTHFSSGSMKINGSGVLATSFGNGTWLSLSKGTTLQPQAAQFSVSGEAGYPFAFAAGEFTITGPAGASWRVVPDVITAGLVTTGNIANPSYVNVGATLYINNGFPGIYTGTMLAGVSYQ